MYRIPVSLQIDVRYIHQIVHDGIDGQAGGGVDLQFSGNVAAMCGYGVD